MSEQNALSEDLLAVAGELEARLASYGVTEPDETHAAWMHDLRRQAVLIRALVADHTPVNEYNGQRWTNYVYVLDDDIHHYPEHVCVGVAEPGWDESCEDGQHVIPACNECRQHTEDADPSYSPWPCPTLRHLADAFLPSRSAVSS